MSLPRSSRVLLAFFLMLVGLVPAASAAQDGSDEPIIVASGLTSPRGMTWDADGTLYVALAGSGGPNAPTEDIPAATAIGPFSGGPTAAVAMIDDAGCPVGVATGLPSMVGGMGDVLGAEDVAILDEELYVSVDGGGAGHGNEDQPSGVYRILEDGSTELVADLSGWSRENPVEELPGADYDPDAAGYSIVADEAAGLLWVSDPNSGQIVSVTPDGEITRIADLSAGHPVPTQMVADPEGGVYVGTLTAVPFPDGAASVWHVAADGTATEVWTGLTTVVGVAVDADGTLYALEMSTGNIEEPPFLQPGSGRLVQQTGEDSHEVVADGLMFPIGLDIGPDGAFYISMASFGSSDGSGMIVRLGGDDAEASPAADASTCAPLEETLYTPPASGSPEAATAEAAEGDTEAEAADEGDAEAVSDQAEVTIEGFAFKPGTLEITVGTTVTWTNNDVARHTATAEDGSFDTGSLKEGESGSVTFDEPGTYTYVCSFHPGMMGTIIVT